MQRIAKRLGVSLIGGVVVQFIFFLLAAVLGSPMLALVLLLPGWALVFAGRDSSPPRMGLLAMLIINAIIYAPLIYVLLWWRPFRKEVLSIRAK